MSSPATGRVRLNLGCGRAPLAGWLNADRCRLSGVELLLDLEQPFLPFADGTVDEVNCSHVLEHVDDCCRLVREIHRILKAGGRLRLEVPHFSSAWAHADPTHKRLFSAHTLSCFLAGSEQRHYVDCEFTRLEQVEVLFERGRWFWFNPLLEWLVNVNVSTRYLYEHTPLRSFPALVLRGTLVK